MAKKKEKKQTSAKELRETLRKDDTYAKYKKIVTRITEHMDFGEVWTEVKRLHEGRLLPNLQGTTPGADQIAKATLIEVRCRSRLTSLILKSVKYHDSLDIVLDETRKYLANEYGEEAPALRTKAERMAYFDKYLTKGIELKKKLKSLMEGMNYVVKDIDQASHATRHLVETLALVLDRNDNKQSI